MPVPKRSFGIVSTMGERIGGARTLTVGELLGFALGVAIIFWGGKLNIPPNIRIVLGLAVILLTETAF